MRVVFPPAQDRRLSQIGGFFLESRPVSIYLVELLADVETGKTAAETDRKNFDGFFGFFES